MIIVMIIIIENNGDELSMMMRNFPWRASKEAGGAKQAFQIFHRVLRF